MKANLRPKVLLPTAVLAVLGIAGFAFAFSGTPGGGGGDANAPLPKHTPAPVSDVKLADWAKQANTICRNLNDDNAKIPTPQSRGEIATLVTFSLDNADRSLAELRALPMPAAKQKDIELMLKHFGQFVSLERKAIVSIQAGDVSAYAATTGAAFSANDKGIVIARELGAGACGRNGSDDTELARQLEKHKVVVTVLYTPGSPVDNLTVLEARAAAALSGVGFVSIDVYDTQEIALVAAEYSTRGAPAVLVFRRNQGAVTQFNGYVDRETIAQAADNAAL
jgi:hypothetical protein